MSNSISTISVRITLLVLLGACGKPRAASQTQDSRINEAWNTPNNPASLADSLVSDFSKLPLKGSLTKTPWTDTYWPNHLGGISYRWNDPSFSKDEQFTYIPFTKAEALGLTPAAIAKLSPAEKYDLYRGDYTFPTVASERLRVDPKDPTWAGICHGWAAVALIFEEPQPVTLKNPDGIEVPFGSADVKALLSYYQTIAKPAARTVSTRCDLSFAADTTAKLAPACRDTNAGSFHIALTNMVGLRNQGVVAEVTRDEEVWNQPVHSYESVVEKIQGPSTNSAPGTMYEVVLTTRMIYTIEIDPRWDAVLNTSFHANRTKIYNYRLEIDASNKIIGGSWLDSRFRPSLDADRPDFLWTQIGPEFTSETLALKTIAEKSGAILYSAP